MTNTIEFVMMGFASLIAVAAVVCLLGTLAKQAWKVINYFINKN